MIHTGLTSVTFRKLPPDEIIRLVQQACLEGVEWGGDVHVPHGNIERAREVYRKTVDAGLRITSYGSYYRVGCEAEAGGIPFKCVLESALILHAPIIRVWAGNQGSQEASPDLWQAVIADARRIALMAAEEAVTIAFEYHENTLTDTAASTERLISASDSPNLKCYWQPLNNQTTDYYVRELKAITPWLTNLHVYEQHGEKEHPLADGKADWLQYLKIINGLPEERDCLLEFVRNDSPEQFMSDAQTLLEIIRELRSN
jgi:3-dehydroshikimate dehydratase